MKLRMKQDVVWVDERKREIAKRARKKGESEESVIARKESKKEGQGLFVARDAAVAAAAAAAE